MYLFFFKTEEDAAQACNELKNSDNFTEAHFSVRKNVLSAWIPSYPDIDMARAICRKYKKVVEARTLFSYLADKDYEQKQKNIPTQTNNN